MEKSKVIEVLAKLGDTVQQVRESLLKMGIKGKKDNTQECPLACYLKKELKVRDLDVEREHVHINGEKVPISDTLNSFITKFDDGEYVELDSEPLEVYPEDDEDDEE